MLILGKGRGRKGKGRDKGGRIGYTLEARGENEVKGKKKERKREKCGREGKINANRRK